MKTDYVDKEIVLLGGGHAHVGVLKSLGMKPLKNVKITLISDVANAPYSGMIPGYIAGVYNWQQCHIDLWPLASFANAQFFCDAAVELDLKNNRVVLGNRPPVHFDILSINTGSTPRQLPGSEYATPVKPISHFLKNFDTILTEILSKAPEIQQNIVVIGAGAGGVELCLSLKTRIHKELLALRKTPQNIQFHLVFAQDAPLTTHNQKVQQIFLKILQEQNITLHQQQVLEITSSSLICQSGKEIPHSHLFLVTNAAPHPMFAQAGLDCSEEGFIQVNSFLQSTSHPHVFAAGDIANIQNYPRPKSGVYSVRAGKPLQKNIRAFVQNRRLRKYIPQKTALALVTTGERYAIASKGNWAAQGKWLWKWKDSIDLKFMEKYQQLKSMEEMQGGVLKQFWNYLGSFEKQSNISLDPQQQIETIPRGQMPCGGCGSKIAASVLSKVMQQIPIIQRDDVLRGLDAPDDAAVIKVPEGKLLLQSVDFFRSFLDDPYLLGKIATLHSLSDIWAMGGEAQSALAMVCVPYGNEHFVENFLLQTMQGCMSVLQKYNCALVGGHTTEGNEASFGLTVNGLGEEHKIFNKSGLQPGQKLVLTKPLGTGTILVSHMHNKSSATSMEGAISMMCQGNYEASQCFQKFSVSSCTDVTGFGLAGHLLEMLQGACVELELSKIPVLTGALEAMEMGYYSSMYPKNRMMQRGFAEVAKWQQDLRFQLLFDPQTSGGLLASVAPEIADEVVNELQKQGYLKASIIGTVLENQQGSFVKIRGEKH